jgi:hypothetical protein
MIIDEIINEIEQNQKLSEYKNVYLIESAFVKFLLDKLRPHIMDEKSKLKCELADMIIETINHEQCNFASYYPILQTDEEQDDRLWKLINGIKELQ